LECELAYLVEEVRSACLRQCVLIKVGGIVPCEIA
jgi:hypothetical protein